MMTVFLSAQIDSIKLNEITVTAESKADKIRKNAVKTEVIDAKSIRQLPVDLTQMLNNISGVRMRQSGGLGANYTLLLNGFQGHSIRYFKDGIPTDYLGTIFSLSSVPLNSIQRVEIYRGILPADLGADALGGAVNIITQENSQQSFLDISGNLGSFNTHRFSLNGKWLNLSKTFYVGASSFYNHSDNNYKVTVPVTDEVTANIKFEKLLLFHNQMWVLGDDGALCFCSHGFYPQGAKGSAIIRIKKNETDFDKNWIVKADDYTQGTTFGNVAVKDGKLYTAIGSEAVNFKTIGTASIYDYYEFDVNNIAKGGTKIKGLSPTQYAFQNGHTIVNIKGDLYFNVSNNDGLNAYYKLENGTAKMAFNVKKGGRIVGFASLVE
ncbi:TonB-dependent receptor plug domain-containing protein [Weeksellaceae bacterium TAE3-ERU29]|nr:TonB-dependent receptor plug domain-containing protein [Weeksellaceae bacterium TAE3-ERU29]